MQPTDKTMSLANIQKVNQITGVLMKRINLVAM